MEKQNTISKHAKRRANKKAQKDTDGTGEEKTRDAQIEELKYDPKETKSNEEMESEDTVQENQTAPETQKKNKKDKKKATAVLKAPVFADKEIVVPSQEGGFTGDKEEWFDDEKYNVPKKGPNFDHAKEHDYYFGSYSSHHIHEEMLKDSHRTLTYQ